MAGYDHPWYRLTTGASITISTFFWWLQDNRLEAPADLRHSQPFISILFRFCHSIIDHPRWRLYVCQIAWLFVYCLFLFTNISFQWLLFCLCYSWSARSVASPAMGHWGTCPLNFRFHFSSLWSKSESQLSKYCVVCEISWCRCQQLTALSISTAWLWLPHDIISILAPPRNKSWRRHWARRAFAFLVTWFRITYFVVIACFLCYCWNKYTTTNFPITSNSLDVESSCSHISYSSMGYGSSSYIKVIGSRSRSKRVATPQYRNVKLWSTITPVL